VGIIRVGLAETKKFAEGYEAIFRKKQAAKLSRSGAKLKRAPAKKRKTKKKR
jgi:hypothetical protein